MKDNSAMFTHIPCKVFTDFGEKVKKDKDLYSDVWVSYNGTNLYGNLTIESKTSRSLKKAVRCFMECYE